MLYTSLSQPYIFLSLSLAGFFCGFLFDLKNIFLFNFKKKQIINQFLQFFALLSTFFIFYIVNLKVNFGELRFFSICGFALSFSIQRFLIKNFVANPIIKCYNKTKEKHNERKNNKMVEKT